MIRTEDAKAAELFGDTLSDLWKVIKSGVFAVGMAIVPLLQDWALSAIQVAKVTADWVRDNKQLIVTVFKIVAGVMAAGAAILTLGVLVYGVGAAFGIAASLITGVGTVLGTIGTVIAALLSPIGLVSVAIVGLGGYLLYASGLGAQALQWLADQFQALKADALAAWQGIGDALAAGGSVAGGEDPVAHAEDGVAEGRRVPGGTLGGVQRVLPQRRDRCVLRRGRSADQRVVRVAVGVD